jgi:hypothetical protein
MNKGTTMNENNTASHLNENAQEPAVADVLAQMTDATATGRPVPPEQNIEGFEAEIERLAEEAAEEAARLAGEIYTEEDDERDIEFGYMEVLRDSHFASLEVFDAQQRAKKIKYPLHEYMVEGLLPLNEVHIIAGETGAGKSTWLFDFLDTWQHEKPVFGRKSHWLPYVIFVNDRSEAGMLRTLERMGLHPKAFPIKSLLGSGNKLSLVQKIEAFHDKNPSLKIVFIEGLHVGQQEGNDYGEASAVMQQLNALCQKRKLTIIATTHVSKVNASKGATDRTSIIGSSATPGMCETVFVLRKDSKKPGRVFLTVHPRNEGTLYRAYKWTNDGRLIETDEKEEQKRIVKYLNQLETETFKTADVEAFYEKRFKVGRDTAKKELREALDENMIARCIDDRTGKEIKGHYRKLDWQDDLDGE